MPVELFFDKVMEVAKAFGRTYGSVNLEYTTHDGLLFKGYIDGGEWIYAKTMQDCLDKLKAQNITPKQKRVEPSIKELASSDLPF